MIKKQHRMAWLMSLAVFLATAASMAADEGLWLFNNPPSALLLKKYNFKITPEWLDHIRLASVYIGGGSASFVSPDGLVLTNHHVGQGALQQYSTKDRDLMKTGFYARTRNEELKVAGMEVKVLVSIEDVTAKVTGAETAGMTPAQAAAARDKVIAGIEKEASERTGLRSTVVSLYSGCMYHLYGYRIFNDVRLVFAPEYAAAFFGGDPDNFTYPRYDLDVCIFRIYENGQPYKSAEYLRWSPAGVKDNELVLVSGNPGSTGRLLSCSQLEFLRDTSYPFSINTYRRRQAYMHEYGKLGPEQARVALRNLFGIENSLKAISGYQSGLLDPKLMARKARDEQDLRVIVKRSPELESEYGSAWDELASAEKSFASFYKPYALFERGMGFYSSYFTLARNIVRLAMEREKPNDKRLREFNDSAISAVENAILTPSPIYDEFEIVKLGDSLAQLKEEAGSMQEVKWILGDRDPKDVARELVSGTRLKDVEHRRKLVAGGLESVYRCGDPMIKLALLVDPVARGLRSRYEKEVEAVEIRDGARIARLMFKIKGTSIPPDATGTLRLSFGPAKGYVENGRKIPYLTTFAGMYERSKKAGNKDPYELPPTILAAEKVINKNVPLNFVATADSIGGNSGSPVVNRKGELVGLLFDGNIQSLPTRFVYEDEISRSVMVDSRGIIEAIRTVYGAGALVDEILGVKK